VDPAQLQGAALDKWYRRSPDEIEEERSLRAQAEYEAFFGDVEATPTRQEMPKRDHVWMHEGGTRWRALPLAGGSGVDSKAWQEAQLQPRRPAPRPAPPPRAGVRPTTRPPSAPVERSPRPGGVGDGFFSSRRPVPYYDGPTYFSDLPRPLNYVRPLLNDWFELGDGSHVRGTEEVERLHAEQQRLIRGQEETAPAARVRSADRFKDGQRIPRARELTKDDRELDATCHPYGGWELDNGYPTYSKRVQRYEAQITRAPGLDYVVRIPGQAAVKFDGCAIWNPRHPLLEAKGPGRAGIVEDAERYGFPLRMLDSDVGQVRRQNHAAQGRPVEWHAAEGRYADALREKVRREKPPTPSTFDLHHTPAH
jgi:hypothetical protein